MKKLFYLPMAVLGVLFFTQFMSCEREPVYIGDLLIIPIDTMPIDTTTIHPCDPDTVYFERDVLPILISNCTMSGCHDVASHEEGVILVDYAYTRNTGGVKLNNPSDSKLYKVLSESGDELMPPPPASSLTAAQKALILKWIQHGAQNLSCDECNTDNVTFAGIIGPLVQTKCAGCHGNNNPGGGVKLLSYNEIKTTADDGRFWGSVNHQASYQAMPPNGTKLPDCDLEQILIWINAGAPNN
ncbi:MAG: c-type cytochrome [Saprospirales bacterium]|nr:c-type cytochrome [Saprospirales bacterium]